MKRIINGKKYNTDTANIIIKLESEYNKSSTDYYCFKLYKKCSGEFFLCTYCSDRADFITLLSKDEAKKWVEDKANDYYEEIFGEVEE